ncbi:MAG: radical SAM protein [Deltaproteobacteria bacterium]|nr:MAG: radical SAM protein [Deltaproteobacteria bacterium]
MRIVFYDNPHSPPVDKSVTGGFGSITEVGGIIGKLYTRMKHRSVKMPALSVVYGISIFKSRGHEVHFCKNPNEVRDVRRADAIFFHAGMPTLNKDLSDLAILKTFDPRTKIIVFGTFPKERPELYEDLADMVILDGEPENIFLKMANGESVEPDLKLGPVNNLDDLPYPLWEYFDYVEFSYKPFLPGGTALPMAISRGCPYNCDYCNYMPQQGKNIRYRSIDSITSEIRTLINNYNVKNIVFRDLVFTLNKNLIIELCKSITKHNLNFNFSIETRTDLLDKKIIEVMAEAGLKHINLGIESFSDKSLGSIGRKPDKIEHQEEVINEAHKRGIKVSAFYIIGLPFDTEESIKENIKYAKKLNTLGAQFCLLTPYPGTPIFEQYKNRLITKDWNQFTEYRPIIKNDNLPPGKLLKLRDFAYRSYYTNPFWMMKHAREIVPW